MKYKIAYLIEPVQSNSALKLLTEEVISIFKNYPKLPRDLYELFLVQNYNDNLANDYNFVIYTNINHFQFLKENYSLDRIFYVKNNRYFEENLENALYFIRAKIDWTGKIKRKFIFPKTKEEIKKLLDKFLYYSELAIDIEAKSLKLTEAGIYSIGFATNFFDGYAFMVKDDEEIKKLLKEFFIKYKGNLIVHNASYDIQILVYELFMNRDFTNLKGQLEGLNTFFKNLDDTMIMAYLCTNNVNKNELGLKKLAYNYLGNWSVDVKDVEKVKEEELLKYNALDCIATSYLHDHLQTVLVQEDQEHLYKDYFIPYLKDCIRMQLNGFSMNQNKIAELDNKLNQEKENLLNEIKDLIPIQETILEMGRRLRDKRNKQLKTKQVSLKDCLQDFNFNSTQWLSCLCYEVMKLPQIEKTKKKALSTSGSTLRKLIEFTDNKEYKLILKNIADYKDCEKIISSFIPNFKNLNQDKNGIKRLNGYFKLGGTVSGRMSSSNP